MTSSILSHHHRAGIEQARQIARAAWLCREVEPVIAFRRWTLAVLLMKRAHRHQQEPAQ